MGFGFEEKKLENFQAWPKDACFYILVSNTYRCYLRRAFPLTQTRRMRLWERYLAQKGLTSVKLRMAQIKKLRQSQFGNSLTYGHIDKPRFYLRRQQRLQSH